MATQAYIIEVESRIIDENHRIRDELHLDVQKACDVFVYECTVSGTGHPYPENRDCWGTLWLNASVALPIHPQLKPLVDTLGREFEHNPT